MTDLTVGELLRAGFVELGCWQISPVGGLVHPLDLPKKAGVYAFAVNELVLYVGLASKSVRQRLGFYRSPGASQRTNVRLNDVIRGQIGSGSTVRILVAHPPDSLWNGLVIKGPEGLEAGLIASFQLPWNVRGAVAASLR